MPRRIERRPRAQLADDERREQHRGTGERQQASAAETQPAVGASTSVNTSRSMAAVIGTAPASVEPRVSGGRRVRCGHEADALRCSATSATGAGRKNTQRQPTSVSRPPITSPSEKPVAPVAV